MLGAVIVGTPFLIGSVHLWAIGTFELFVWLTALIHFSANVPVPGSEAWRRGAYRVACFGLILIVYCALQLVPLPADLLGIISPATTALHAKTAERIGASAQTTIALYPFNAWVDVTRMVAYALIVAMAASSARPGFLLRALAAAGIAMAIIAIAENVHWNGKILWMFAPYDGFVLYPRMSGAYVNPDHFAAFMELTLLPAAGLVLWIATHAGHRSRRRRRPGRSMFVILIWSMGLLVMGAALVGSASRGGIVGACLGLLVVAAASRSAVPAVSATPRKRRRRDSWDHVKMRAAALAPAALAIVVVVGGLLYSGHEARELLDLRLGRTVIAPDLDMRMHLWSQTLPMIGDFRWFGVGLRGWQEAFYQYGRWPILGKRANHAHNDYVEWIAEVGIVGIALSFVVVVAYVAWVRRNKAIPGRVRAGLIAALVALAWHEFFDFNLRVSGNAVALATILGLLANERWEGDVDEGDAARDRSWPMRLAQRTTALAAVLLLSLWSAVQIREFISWSRVREGRISSLDPETRNAATWQLLGSNLARSGDADGAAKAFREAVSRRFLFGQAYFDLASADGTARESALAAAVAVDPTNSTWSLTYASVLEASGQIEAARREVVNAFRYDPRPHVHEQLQPDNPGIKKPLREAIESGLRAAVEDSDWDPELLHSLAWFYFRRFGEWPEAAQYWLRAAQLSGDWQTYGPWAAESLGQLGQFEKGEEVAKRTIEAAPGEPAGYRVLALAVYVPQKRFEDAEKTLESGIERAQSRESLFVALSQVKEEKGDRAAALEMLRRGVLQYPRSRVLLWELGSAYLEAEDFTRAKATFAQATQVFPTDPLLNYLAGFSAERLYAMNEARSFYGRAVQLNPASALFRKALDRVQSAFGDNHS